jgi:hypothetical protein
VVPEPQKFPVLLTLPSLFSYLYSYPFHFLSLSCATIQCSPSQLLVLPFSSTLFPIFTSLSYPPPTCQHTNPPSYTLTTHWLDNCTNYARPWPPAIPDTSTFHYNRNIPKHAQGPQNPAVPFLSPHLPTLFPTPLLVPHLPISQISISSLITITLPNSH